MRRVSRGTGDLDSYRYAPTQKAEGKDYSVFGTVSYKPPALPKLKLSTAARYEWRAGFFVRAEASFVGEIALEARGRAIQPAVGMHGVQVGFEREQYSLRIFGKNLTNERRMSGLAVENLAFRKRRKFPWAAGRAANRRHRIGGPLLRCVFDVPRAEVRQMRGAENSKLLFK
jgi:hypothetical protein